MTSAPPTTDPVARAYWHLELGYYEADEDIDDDRGDVGYYEPATCWNCGGEGFVITCPDDLCHGAGECFHGDGHEMCRECQGSGLL